MPRNKGLIKIVFSDIDGVFGNFIKPIYPDQQDIEPHKGELNKIKEIIRSHEKSILHVICTGRAFYSCEPILKYLEINTPCICEHGTFIYLPDKKTSYPLVEKAYPKLIKASRALTKWLTKLYNDKRISKDFPNVSIRRENKNILTIRAKNMTPQALYNKLKRIIPKNILAFIEHDQLKIIMSQDINNDVIKSSIDIMPNIDKGDAVRYILEFLNLKKENALGIEDSYHSGITMLKETGFVACPANAQDELKKFVRKRNGYVSPFSYSKGWADIINHFIG